MQIVVNEFGTFIGKQENRFRVINKELKEEYSADKIDQIKILCSSSISSGAVKLAMQNNIDVIFTNMFGQPYARIYPCKLGGTTLTRREQAKAYLNEKGIHLTKKFIEAKIKNQLFLLIRLNKTRSNIFSEELRKIKEELEKFDSLPCNNIDSIRADYLGFEGYSASLYFSCLNKIIAFGTRDPKSKDIFNISLNYGYGILYSEIERACIIAGLDPYLGFLHTDRYGKPSMVLDLIEQFRSVVDKAIIKLFVQKRLDKNDLEIVEKQIILTKDGRSKIVNEVLEGLNQEIKYKKQKIAILKIIQDQAREIVRFLLDQTKNYEPFVWVD